MDGTHDARVYHVECGSEEARWEKDEDDLEEERGEGAGLVGRDYSGCVAYCIE
jgi:hypothetical protein